MPSRRLEDRKLLEPPINRHNSTGDDMESYLSVPSREHREWFPGKVEVHRLRIRRSSTYPSLFAARKPLKNLQQLKEFTTATRLVNTADINNMVVAAVSGIAERQEKRKQMSIKADYNENLFTNIKCLRLVSEVTSRLARLPGFKTRNFFSRFSQSVDM